MNYLFKAAAGVMSALVLAAGASSAAETGRVCPQNSPDSCTASSLCENKGDCTNYSSEDLQRLVGECESTSEMVKVLLDKDLCSRDDLDCIINNNNCTMNDIYEALENCNTDSCDIVSVIERACAEQNDSCAESTVSDCEGTDCASEIPSAPISDEQTVSDTPSEIDDVSEQINENIPDCSDNNCATICDSDKDCTSIKCQDSDCSSESPSDSACSEPECASEAAKENRKDSDSKEKNTFNSIYDILKAFGIEITSDTACDSENGCTEKTPQSAETQYDTETAAPIESDTDSSNANTVYEIADYEAEVVRLVNEIRVSYGLRELKLNENLSAVARLKSEDMRDKHYFSHNSPTYGSPFEMMNQFGINYRTAGENIAMGQRTPQEVVNGWMNSDGHRANILNDSFTEIGVGYIENGHYWTQMFIG